MRRIALLIAVFACGFSGLAAAAKVASGTGGAATPEPSLANAAASARAVARDSLGDGFPDAVRIVRPEDRATFVRWLTFLAEAQYYDPDREASAEIHDCAGLIRFAFRNALMAHTTAWRRSVLGGPQGAAQEIESEADFGDLHEFTYPKWALGPNLFRTRAGPLAPRDPADGAFAQFADVATLLHYNTFFISRDVRAARPGDVFFYYQPGHDEPYHSMLFVGRSFFQPRGADWVVYDTGDINGKPGEVREVEAKLLVQHPDPRWRPLASNPRFLGVYRLELLR